VPVDRFSTAAVGTGAIKHIACHTVADWFDSLQIKHLQVLQQAPTPPKEAQV